MRRPSPRQCRRCRRGCVPGSTCLKVGAAKAEETQSFYKFARRPRRVASGTATLVEQFDCTSAIGREFPTLQLSEILHDNVKAQDLAILGTHTHTHIYLFVIYTSSADLFLFPRRNQQEVGRPYRQGWPAGLRGAPSLSQLEISTRTSSPPSSKISLVLQHTDNTSEPIPFDYAVLKMTRLPEDIGGDTLWASC